MQILLPPTTAAAATPVVITAAVGMAAVAATAVVEVEVEVEVEVVAGMRGVHQKGCVLAQEVSETIIPAAAAGEEEDG